jgi:hypothetical protein
MNYTAAAEKSVEDKIDRDMKIICNEILEIAEPISIVLIGSFGRGEGSVIHDGRSISALRDYDILLVLLKKLPPAVLHRLEKKINNRLGYGRAVNQELDLPIFGVSLIQLTSDELFHLNDIKILELKLGSRILYGKDVRNKLKVSVEGLPLSSSARFLFNSILGLIAVFKTKYIEKPLTGLEKVNLVYECGKMYIEMGTILTLLGRMYRPRYGERCEVIRKNLKNRFPDLLRKAPSLDHKIDFFTNLKLFPDMSKFEEIDPVALWFETRRDVEQVLKFFMLQYLRIKNNNLMNFCDACFQNMSKIYLDDVISFYSKLKYGISFKLITRLVNFIYRRLIGFKYMVRLRREEGVIATSALKDFPILRIFTCAPLLLYSLQEDGSKDQLLFDAFTARFKRIYPVKMGQSSNWDEAKKHLLKAYFLYSDCGGML